MSFQSQIEELMDMHDRLYAPGSRDSVRADDAFHDDVIARLDALGRTPSFDAGDLATTPMPRSLDGFPTIPGFRVIKLLGHGGMGVVYLAEQISLKRLVALKMLTGGSGSAEAEAKMREEAAALARVSHQNVVSVYEVGDANGRTYLALEYLAGGSLADRLPKSLYAPREAAELVRTIARAIQTIHDRGLLHCDLKPANVLLSEDGIPKVADFGLARLLDDDQRQTRTGTLRGTPCYMPPEQADGLFESFGPAVDVYSLGGILYEVLTGRPPFLGATILDTLDQVRSKDPVPVRTLQPAVQRDLETICLKCLSKRPEKRYASAAQLAEELTAFLEQRPIEARPPGRSERGVQWCRRNPSRAALLGVCFAVMLFAVIAAGWVHARLNADFARMQAARDDARANARAAHATLVRQAAERIDGEMEEIAVRPMAAASVLESHPLIDEAECRIWLAKLVESDPRIHGLRVALDPEGGDGFALLVHRGPAGLVYRRMDREGLATPYWQREWYVTRGVWTEPYASTDAARSTLVSFTVPIRRGDRVVGVVAVDVSLGGLKSLREDLRDLIPNIDRRAVLATGQGTILYHPDGRTGPADDGAFTGDGVLNAELPTTKWKLSISFPPEIR